MILAKEIETYKELQDVNNTIKRKGNYQPMTIVDVVISPKGIGMDMITFTNGQSVRIAPFLGTLNAGMYALTNPSKLTNWRGFIR